LPSSVPAQRIAGVMGDSDTLITVLKFEMPSFFDSMVTLPG
jgi:hypothetical protein